MVVTVESGSRIVFILVSVVQAYVAVLSNNTSDVSKKHFKHLQLAINTTKQCYVYNLLFELELAADNTHRTFDVDGKCHMNVDTCESNLLKTSHHSSPLELPTMVIVVIAIPVAVEAGSNNNPSR